MKKKKYILFIILCILPALYFSQEGLIVDSLSNLYKTTSNDTQKINLCHKLGQLYCSIDFNKALNYSDSGIVLSKKINNTRKLAESYNLQGIVYINLGKFKEAEISLNNAIDLHLKNGNKKGIASAYGNLGTMYYVTGTYGKSLEYHLKCLEINELLDNKNGIAISLMNVANIHFIQKDFAEARKYYADCRIINKNVGNLSGELNAIHNIGSILIEQGKPDEAIPFFDTVRIITEKKQPEYSVEYATAIKGLGNSYRLKGEYSKAHFYLKNALQLFKKQNNTIKLLEILGNLSALHLKEKDYLKSIEYAKSYLEKSKSLKTKQHERDAHEYLYENYFEIKDYKNALMHHNEYVRLKDSILSNENLKNLSELETKYETEKKEIENKTLIQKNQIQSLEISKNRIYVFALIGILILFFTLTVVTLRQNKLKSQQKSLVLEQKLLRSQMNPHFIFNSLQAIQNFILKKNEKEAAKFLSSFALLTRAVLENSRMEIISLKKEITLLNDYLALQKLRFGQRFEYSITISPEIDPDYATIPPMLSQPFIENAIEHGMRDIESGGMISISFAEENNNLLLEIKDNGKGMNVLEENRKHHSLAMTITKERIELLNKKSTKKIRFTISDAYPEYLERRGVKVNFIIPL